MEVPPPPIIVVSRHGDFGASIDRAKALREPGDQGLIELDPPTVDVPHVGSILSQHGANTPVPIVYLVGDLDQVADEVPSLVDEARRLVDALKREFAATPFRVWFVFRIGRDLGPAELAVAEEAERHQKAFAYAGSLVVTISSGASQRMPEEVVDREVGDLLHILATSAIEQDLTSTEFRTWAVGVGSVAFRPDALIHGATLAIEDTLESIVVERVRDPAYGQGRRWVDDRNLGVPCPGDDRDDTEGRALLVGPGRGSLAEDPARELRRLDSNLDAVDPGRWAGMISATVDVATAPRTEPRVEQRSPLVVAFDALDVNLRDRKEALAADLENEARRVLREQQNVPAADAWCEGASAAIQTTIDDLESHGGAETRDLAARYQRLARTARSLPYSSSLLVRGLLIVVVMVVVGYVYAPIGTFVAWVFSKEVFWFGDTLEDNARMWARITAALTGIGLWIWWEAMWRRVRRFRRQYVADASAQMRTLVEERARAGRISMLQELIELIGTPSGPDGSLRRWLNANRTAIQEVLDEARVDQASPDPLRSGRWAAVLPSDDDPSRVVDGLDDDRLRALRRRPLDVVCAATLESTVAKTKEAVQAAIHDGLPGADRDLASHWGSADAVGELAREALGAELWAALPEQFPAPRGRRTFVADRTLEAILRAVFGEVQVTEGLDPNFAANLWVRPIPLGPTTAESPDSGSTPESGADAGDSSVAGGDAK